MFGNHGLIRQRLSAGEMRHIGELTLIAFAFLFYFLVRGLVVERVDEAIERAEALIRLEQTIGVFIEPTVQAWILGSPLLIDAANSMYLYGHGPVIAVFAVLLYLKRRPHYLLMRNAFLISGAIGLVFYYVTPVAPPRFMPDYGFVDTVFESYGVERVLMPSLIMNQYAAMPSLHFGWNLLCGIGIWMAFTGVPARTFAVVMPAAMLAAIVVTGNHFVLDAAVGGVVVLAGLAIAVFIRRVVARIEERQRRYTGLKGRSVAFLTWLSGVHSEPVPGDRHRAAPTRGSHDAAYSVD